METKRCSKDNGARKPAGGFCFIRGTAILSAWAAYRGGEIELIDLRVWFACWEALSRRCGLGKGRAPKYRIDEIRTLVHGTDRGVHESLETLSRLGLLSWSESSIEFAEASEFSIGNGFLEVFDLVPNHGRLVPVPRRMLRLIARGARKVVIATILGHLLRGLYYKKGLCLPEGTCKSSWIAEVFGVDVRNVKAARKELVALRWLMPIATKQVHLNRYGSRFRINLEWGSGNDISRPAKRSPPPPKTTTGSPPPYKDKKLSTRIEKPETRQSGPAGVFQEWKREAPDLRNVQVKDLDSATRLFELFAQAVGEGLVKPSDMDRLNFFAAAEHARTVGTKNRCGLFVAIVRRGLWRHITLADEDAARAKLRKLSEVGKSREHGLWSGESGQKGRVPDVFLMDNRGSSQEASDADRARIRAEIFKPLRRSELLSESSGRFDAGGPLRHERGVSPRSGRYPPREPAKSHGGNDLR